MIVTEKAHQKSFVNSGASKIWILKLHLMLVNRPPEKFKQLNLAVAFALSLFKVGWYLFGPQPALSDNVDMFLLPIMVLFVYFPIFSLLAGAVETAAFWQATSYHWLGYWLKTQTIAVLALAAIGLFGYVAA
jgi:hypothetical protein